MCSVLFGSHEFVYKCVIYVCRSVLYHVVNLWFIEILDIGSTVMLFGVHFVHIPWVYTVFHSS